MRPSTCEAAQQARHADQACEGAAPPGSFPSAVHSPTRAATAQPSSGVSSLLPGPHVTVVAGALTTDGGSPATAAANPLPCPPTAGVAGDEATTAGIQSTNADSGTIPAGQGMPHSRLQTLKALPSGTAQGLDSPARIGSHLTARQAPGELPQVTVPSLDQLAQGPMQTPGVVKAWNGVAQLLQHMTPASEVCCTGQAHTVTVSIIDVRVWPHFWLHMFLFRVNVCVQRIVNISLQLPTCAFCMLATHASNMCEVRTFCYLS